MKDELKGVMIDRDYYSESCKIHRKDHEQWMQQYFSKQQELQELTLEFMEDSRKRTDMELVNLKRSSCGTTPPPLKKKRPNELIVLDKLTITMKLAMAKITINRIMMYTFKLNNDIF